MKEAVKKFEQYIKSRYPNSPTHKHYVYDLRQFDRLIGKPPSEVTRADVQRFVDDQLERGRAPTTINRRLAALRVFFGLDHRFGHWDGSKGQGRQITLNW